MKKWIIALSSLLVVSLLAGCNMPTKKTDENKPVNQEQTTNTLNIKNITIFIDKNCENAQIPQCQADVWKQQFAQLLSWTKYNIEYISDDNINSLKKVSPTTPVMAIPESELSVFGQQAWAIKQQAKLVNWVYYIPLFGWIAWEENLCNDGKDNNGDGKADAQDPTCFKMDVLSSANCKEQYCNPEGLKNMFMWYTVNIIDYNTEDGKNLYEKLLKINWKQYLPTFLFNEKKVYMDQMKDLIKEHKEGCKYKYQLDIPQFNYDPKIEACASDCNASPSCKKLLTCNKSDKPNVELFVMSYCPFGTQAEKGILWAVNALKWKINFEVKFVNYAMHGKKEIDENNLQHCIQKEEPAKYNDYLVCFLEAWNSQDCVKKANLDMNKINKCIEDVKSTYKTEEDFNNKASWLNGRFPMYRVNDDLNKQYGVQGSPTLIINGIKVQPESRSPQAYLKAICEAFTNPPAECQKALSNQSYDPMWGWTQNGQAAPAGSCGN